MSNYINVVSFSPMQAREFAKGKGFSESRIRFIDSRQKMMGLRGEKLYVLESARMLDDFHRIMVEAQIYQFDVEYVGELPEPIKG